LKVDEMARTSSGVNSSKDSDAVAPPNSAPEKMPLIFKSVEAADFKYPD